jgi:hypothetical protein
MGNRNKVWSQRERWKETTASGQSKSEHVSILSLIGYRSISKDKCS